MKSFHSYRGNKFAVIGLFLLTGALSPLSLNAQKVFDVLNNQSQVSLFAKIVQESGVDADLNNGGPYTIFAPSNSALNDAQGRINRSNTSSLRSFVMNHVMTGMATKRQIMLLSSAPTLGGVTLEMNVEDDEVTVNDIPIVRYNIRADNGVIHIIDGTLE